MGGFFVIKKFSKYLICYMIWKNRVSILSETYRTALKGRLSSTKLFT